ncbi:MAG: glutamate-1-semialdehyde 2,1-aminomutase [Verrucomicrobia bacterium]|nr:MAG: glutamate-1-semialdehyde 2,1-aminomutase [Verrucomicrobiota bacterium]
MPHDSTHLPGNHSQDLWKRALDLIPGGVNSPVRAFKGVGGEPFFVTKAKGFTITDADGRDYVDFVGTWGPAILGHAPDCVIGAVREAALNGTSFGIPNPLEVEMAETICRLVPSVEKVRMVNSGTEAVMSCIRLARGVTARDRIVKFEGCYHGHVDSLLVKAGSGALTLGQPDSAGIPSALAELTITVPFNDIEALKTVFREGGKEIAAVILEPVPANAGLYLPKPGFLEGVQALCREYGALLIFDEVMTGFRLAPGGAQEVFGIRPDLTAMGKVIGGGLPVGAFGGRRNLMDWLAPLGPVYQAGTLSGNPLALTAGLAQLREMERINGWQLLEELGMLFEEGMRRAIHGKEMTFQRIGSMFCLYFRQGPILNLADAKESDTTAFAHFFHQALDRGIYLAPSQFEAGFLSTAHSPEVLEDGLKTLTDILKGA